MDKPTNSHQRDPLARLHQIRNQCKADRNKYTEAKYLRAQDIAINEVKLRANNGSWRKFCRLKLWKTEKTGNPPKLEDQSTALHHSFVFAYATITNGRDMPSLHCRAVKAILADSVPRDQIAAELKKRGGFKRAVEKSQYNCTSAQEHLKSRVKKNASKKTSPVSMKRLPLDLDSQLIVDLPKTKMKKIYNLKSGDHFWVLCEHKGSNEQGMFIFKGIEFDKL